ncbi:MAG TPA: arginine--tRNA ligase [Gemmataceae bacterium]|jgi:arginyl-tRNA synthetase
MNVLALLQRKLQEALTGMADDPAVYALMLKPAQGARFGDYQANCAMSLAKKLGKKPPEVAKAIVERLPLDDMLETPAVAGPGFINLTLKSEWLARQAQHMASDDRLGVAPVASPRTIVLDYSSPNVAKPMHVGHLRSTIIGDALARLLRFLGHNVVTDNHLGDWGTQFGILLYGYKHFLDAEAFQADPVHELARLYVLVRKQIKKIVNQKGEEEEDPNDPIAQAARDETARLHQGDEENLRLWRTFMPYCYAEIEAAYRRLDILPFDYTLGESIYQPVLGEVVRSLLEQGIARESEGAIVVFFGENEAPAVIRKRDGASTYTTTDLATIRHRADEWQADTILYVVDFRQGLHFKNLFEIVRRWGYDDIDLQHISFGSVLGEDGKPLSTREGTGASLESLLDAAVDAAAKVAEQNRREQLERGEEVGEGDEQERRHIHEVIGIGAVKYADLSQNRTSDYTFSLKKMLAMDGNTATYMQYAYVRNRGIFRKGAIDVLSLRQNPPPLMLPTSEERALALQLLRFHDALTMAAAEYKPSAITSYLWDLAKTYSGFFQNCPVLKAETPELRQSRLLLCDLTARVIQRGLDLLGIRTVERM